MQATSAPSASEIRFVRDAGEPFEKLPYLAHVLADHWRELTTETELAALGVTATAPNPAAAIPPQPVLGARAQGDPVPVH